MNKINVEILDYGQWHHVSQILTGFIELGKKGLISLSYNLEKEGIKLPSFGAQCY